ncbi:hypothetical protein [Rubrivirga marina]|uniref:Uncharacterized protein n=1 Tax=Rubrivirga marina TaxID=1196024 RepID=A0A271J3D5_9BACT|nr:hypothetical protein [Rubrivirga marina]PAP78012.1 hypothetical protein BSZ37_16975 [Rubrivirga marina]
MPSDSYAPQPKRGVVLDETALREAAEEAVRASRLTQARVAEVVAEQIEGRDRVPSPSAISNAVRETGPKVAALQIDIIRALTGATITGPLYRVD